MRRERSPIYHSAERLRDFSEGFVKVWRFDRACVGSILDFAFVYKVYKEPVPLHLPAVDLQKENRFILSFFERRPSGPLQLKAIDPRQ
jgi:hypothetical protein